MLGSWRWDNGKTLRNLQVPAEGSQELLESAQRARTFVANLNAKLNSNVVVSFSKNEYTQSTFGPGGDVFSRESVPYRVIEVHADRIVIADQAEGGTSTLFFDGPDSFYVEVSVGTFIYKDYFTREP